ncbi:membrane protein of unknown function [Kyrpidia spormannii]|uniref:Acyltransferase 3 domain-containing protein n=2 Tax=Kyrpidia spormannii TaxID=2055160 RepID=A0A6F9E718_9BACL|nr:membrane protein of unknown function [Kyrpidia spormannii]CAB3392239.1 membrane protein of unknown function [Kyrpidia spormannii]
MPGLDGLRALAVLAVLAYHLNPGWAPGGMLGVGVFFVLSGYLITDLLAEEWRQTGRIDLRDFWMRRFRRLIPALWLLLITVILVLLVSDPGRLGSLWGDLVAAFFYVSNWWYIFHHISYFQQFGPPSPFGHLWSLAVEEQFYLLWPLLLALGLRRLSRRWMLTGILTGAILSAGAMAWIYQPGVDPSRVYYGTDTRAFALLFGAALALVWPSRHLAPALSRGRRRLLSAAGIAGLLVVLILCSRCAGLHLVRAASGIFRETTRDHGQYHQGFTLGPPHLKMNHRCKGEMNRVGVHPPQLYTVHTDHQQAALATFRPGQCPEDVGRVFATVGARPPTNMRQGKLLHTLSSLAHGPMSRFQKIGPMNPKNRTIRRIDAHENMPYARKYFCFLHLSD